VTVSIIIPCYNAARWVIGAVGSALGNCQPGDEVLVIDDGSTDGGGELVRQSFPQVRVAATPNRGVSHARNLGIELARGDYFVFLDADDLLTENSVAHQLEAAKATGAEVVYGDWQRLIPGPDGSFTPGEVMERHMIRPPEIELFVGFWCPPGAYLYSRSIVAKVGGFSPRLPVIQDSRFALDCALRGAAFVHSPGVACLYRVHDAGSVSTRSRTAFLHDCLTSALEVRDRWIADGGLSPERRQAVFGVLEQVATGSVGVEPETFEAACAAVHSLGPEAGGSHRRSLVRVLNRWLGYRTTQKVRAQLRQVRAWLRPRR
jgi:hypothetical protein